MKHSVPFSPATCLWLQCSWNCWPFSMVLVAAAEISCPGCLVQICFCSVWICDKEYRLSTCHGAQILCLNPREIRLRQGKYELHLRQPDQHGDARHPHCRFSEADRVLLDQTASHARIEWGG